MSHVDRCALSQHVAVFVCRCIFAHVSLLKEQLTFFSSPSIMSDHKMFSTPLIAVIVTYLCMQDSRATERVQTLSVVSILLIRLQPFNFISPKAIEQLYSCVDNMCRQLNKHHEERQD